MDNVVDNQRARRLLGRGVTLKHDYYADFGFPADLTFNDLVRMYNRHPIARAAVEKYVSKTWQDFPWLLEQERDGSERGIAKRSETSLEKGIRQHFRKIRFWKKLADADRMSLVGRYSGVILRIADNQAPNMPVGSVNGITALAGVVPFWENQLKVKTTDEKPNSPTFGEIQMYEFTEPKISATATARTYDVHPDRVIIWSEDGSMTGDYPMAAGYNELVNMEKISGAGGEGFWKNAKAAPFLEVDKEADIPGMAQVMGVEPTKLVDAINAQMAQVNAGFDKTMMLMGMNAKLNNVSIPDPEHYFGVSLQSFAASRNIPVKILVGMQTGERASTEDANEWNATNNARRSHTVTPLIDTIIDALVRFNILPPKDWFVDWSDLTESSAAEKIERAFKMADINSKQAEVVFTSEEIREVADYEPLAEDQKYKDDEDEHDDTDQHSIPGKFQGSDPNQA